MSKSSSRETIFNFLKDQFQKIVERTKIERKTDVVDFNDKKIYI